MIKLANCLMKKNSSSHLERFRHCFRQPFIPIVDLIVLDSSMYMALKSLNKHSGQPTFSKVKYFHQEYFLTIISLREYDSNPLVCKMSVAIRSDLLLFFLSIGLSVFTDFKRMPGILKENPEELWQLDAHSPFPDEVEIVVPEDRSFKGYIRPKGDLDTPFTKDNIIEVNLMFLIAYIKSPFRKELCIGMYKTANFFPKKDFHTVQSRFIRENLR